MNRSILWIKWNNTIPLGKKMKNIKFIIPRMRGIKDEITPCTPVADDKIYVLINLAIKSWN